MPSIGIDKIVNSVLKMDGGDADPTKEINLVVIVDETLDPELAIYARNALRPTSDNVSLRVVSYCNDAVDPGEGFDLAIVLANASPWTGAVYEQCRAHGTKTVVIAQNLALVVELSEQTQFPLDYADVLSPEIKDVSLLATLPGGEVLEKAGQAGSEALGIAADVLGRQLPRKILGYPLLADKAPAPDEEEDAHAKIFRQLADWVMSNCPDFRTAFAGSFNFARPAEVGQIARRTAYENAVTGAVFFIPGADFPVMTLNQLKMLVQIERAYGHNIDVQLIVEAGAVVAAAFVSRTVAHAVCQRVPMLSWLVKIACGYFITLGMGKAMIAHCEAGRQLPEPAVRLLERIQPRKKAAPAPAPVAPSAVPAAWAGSQADETVVLADWPAGPVDKTLVRN